MEKEVSRRKLLAAAGSALSASIAGCSFDAPGSTGTTAEDTEENPEPGDFPEEFQPPEQDAEELPADSKFTETYRDVVDSVAAVRIETFGQTAGGTAWVYDDSHLVTNEHVVSGGGNPFLWFSDVGWREASVVGTDINSDLAVLEVEEKPDVATPLTLVEEPKPVGTEVAAIGNPFGLTGSFTTGIVSGRNRNVPVPGRQFSISNGIQTDAALNPGNSGGPLVTLDGDVVGTISAGQGDNIGFAISARMIRQVVPALIERGEYRHAYMGIGLGNVTPGIIEANDLPVSWGVYVDGVVADGPASGVLRGTTSSTVVNGQQMPVGGDVIVRMGDWSIINEERLSAFLALEARPGETIEVEIIRDGERQTVDLTLGAREDADI